MKIARMFMRVLLRTIYGTAVLICLSEFLKMQGVSTIAQVTPLNVLTLGIFGFSGLVILYGIIFLTNL